KHTRDRTIYKRERFTGVTVPYGWGGLTIIAEGKEDQVTSYVNGRRQRESLCRQTPVFKTIGILLRLIHYHRKSEGKTRPYNSITSHWVSPQQVRIVGVTIQD
uniref:Uncharacterized protein n=1 Tax=Macaca mulatta TaxID=9544 RepID=A0A5F7ZC14_MACMU